MKQQLIISGLGGQGVLTLTRLLAYAAAAQGLGLAEKTIVGRSKAQKDEVGGHRRQT